MVQRVVGNTWDSCLHTSDDSDQRGEVHHGRDGSRVWEKSQPVPRHGQMPRWKEHRLSDLLNLPFFPSHPTLLKRGVIKAFELPSNRAQDTLIEDPMRTRDIHVIIDYSTRPPNKCVITPSTP